MQCSATVQGREMREVKSTKRFKATQHGSARKRFERKKVNEEVQGNAARQCKKEKGDQ